MCRSWMAMVLCSLLVISCGSSGGDGPAEVSSEVDAEVGADLVDAGTDVPSDLVEPADLWDMQDKQDLADNQGGDVPGEDETSDVMGPDCEGTGALPTYGVELLAPVVESEIALPEGVGVKVVSLNVYGGKMGTAEQIGAWLSASGADLVGLQECSADFGGQIAAQAGYQHTYGDGTFMMSKTELVGAQSVALLLGRGFVRAQTVIDGEEFTFYNTHLGWNADGDMQFRLFVDDHLKKDESKRIVLTGDFNDEHYSTQNTILEEWGVDCFTAAGIYPGQRISWPSFGFDDTEGSQLIDLVWFRRDFQAIVIEADVVNVPGLLSDHKPVVARLLYPRGDAPFDADPLAAARDPWRSFPAPLPPNLLVNPGAEDGIEGWEISGLGVAAGQRENQFPRGGAQMFAGFEVSPGAGQYWSAGAQSVDLRCHAGEIDQGSAVVWVSGYITTGYKTEQKGDVVSNVPKPYDDGELILELLESSGGVLKRWSSGRRDTLGWHPATGAVAVPPGVRSARLTWLSHHKEANGPSNDALFDDLYLGLGLMDGPHGVITGNAVADGGAESGEMVDTATLEQVGIDGKSTWFVATDLLPMGPFGLYPYAPWSYSGRHFFVSTPKKLPAAQQSEAFGAFCWPIDQVVAVGRASGSTVTLHISARLRTYKSLSRGWLSLQPGDGSGFELWRSQEVFGAEWTKVEGSVALDAESATGAQPAYLCLNALHLSAEDPVFADEVEVEVVTTLPK